MDADQKAGGESLFFRTLNDVADQRQGPQAARTRLVLAHLNAATRVQCCLHEALARHGLTNLQFAALVVLFAVDPAPLTNASIAEFASVTRSAVTDALDRLEALRVVTRTRGRLDRRVVDVRLTYEGGRLAREAINDYLCAAADAAQHLESADACGLGDRLGLDAPPTDQKRSQ